ncbi:MAG: nickel pincer cofactor biosynthesis protein LarB [Chlorobi bacterium]|nr:nickel pincer cofactor biosynthesis protein LarB [Chlorobiota bacterium]
MNKEKLTELLQQVKDGRMDIRNAVEQLKHFPTEDLGYANIDYHRELRRGYPEIIFAEGKSIPQLTGILESMLKRENNIMITRATRKEYEAVKKVYEGARYYEEARIISIERKKETPPKTYIPIVTAGTSDIPVAEEAAVTAKLLGNNVHRIFDVGVSGIHRLVNKLPEIKQARVVIVIAGMEGALASILAGLIDKPIVAVPTSVGYGTNLQGLTPLLAMLTSCSGGIAVVNIDNGFGAGYYASMINKL